MRIKCKDDVERRGDGYDRDGIYRWLPTVNVKLYRWDLMPTELHSIAADFPEIGADTIAARWDELTEDHPERADMWLDAARECGWEDLQSLADEVWEGHAHPMVRSDGRSGGWAVVDGLPPVESWDAIALGRWVRWARWARQTADNVLRAAVWLYVANELETERENVERVTVDAVL